MSESPQEKSIATTVHGRYYLEGSEAPGAPLLVGFHGYGENARNHLRQLRRIEGVEQWRRCGVQALSLFYNNKTGDVLGSWMTKLGREQAIEDNIRYVASVLRQIGAGEASDGETGGHPLVYAGFSQGVAMAYRAAAWSGLPCHGLIALAGDVPPDLVAESSAPLPPILLGRGTEDAWYNEEKMQQDLEILTARGAEVETCVFPGGHEWGQAFIDACGGFLARLCLAAGASATIVK
jgi:predicted esterase